MSIEKPRRCDDCKLRKPVAQWSYAQYLLTYTVCYNRGHTSEKRDYLCKRHLGIAMRVIGYDAEEDVQELTIHDFHVTLLP